MALVPACPAVNSNTPWYRAFRRSAVVIIDSRSMPSVESGGGRGRDSSGAEVRVSEEALAEAETAEAKKKLHLLTLQTLKYSTLWIILRVSPRCYDGARVSAVMLPYRGRVPREGVGVATRGVHFKTMVRNHCKTRRLHTFRETGSGEKLACHETQTT